MKSQTCVHDSTALPASERQLMLTVWRVAYPMIVSTASSTVIIFSDRLFLARVSKEALAASMPAGVTAFMLMAFFVGVIGYVNALTGQYCGAGDYAGCARTAWQGLYLAGFAWLVILLGIWPGVRFLERFSADPAVFALEARFFTILTAGSIFALAGNALSSFFAGLGRTRVVMAGNLLGMAVNVPLNAFLVFGLPANPWLHFGGWGVSGAAFASVLAMATSFAYFWRQFRRREVRRKYGTIRHRGFDRTVFGKLVRYGVPSGAEYLLNVAAFNFFILLIGSLGVDEQAAVNITFSWNLLAFLPIVGIGIATTTLVGQQMGRRDPRGAERVTFAAMKIAALYAGVIALLFVGAPGLLVDAFSGGGGADYAAARGLARQLLVLAAIYTLTDALTLVSAGALRGAGDTRFTMIASALLHWFLLVLPTALFVHLLHLDAVHLWIWFIAFTVALALVFFRRFRGGAWKTIRVITPADPGHPLPVAGEPAQSDL